jgi:hypothetical protein
MISRILICACTAIILFLASVHLAYTFFTHKFSPTEGQLETAMKQVAPRISTGMTMWKAWIGFHVSHSMGLMPVRLDLRLPRRTPMGSAAAATLSGRARIASAHCIYRAGPHLLVQGSFHRDLFGHAILRCGTCWGIRAHMRTSVQLMAQICRQSIAFPDNYGRTTSMETAICVNLT